MSTDGFPNVWEVDEKSYGAWMAKAEPELVKTLAPCEEVCFSVVMPTFNTPLEFLREAIESVISQTHANWQLCIANDASTDPAVWAELERYGEADRRVRLVNLHENVGIASASNHALKLATGDYIVLMDHDDVIPSHALQTVANILRDDPGIKFLYSDSDHLDESGRRCKPFFKPDWDYIRLLGQNYLNHLTVIQHSLLKKVGGWRQGYEGSQDYDLFLRLQEHTERQEIKHIPHILYHWRMVPDSVSRSSLGRSVKAARQAINDHLARIGLAANVRPAGKAVIYNWIEWSPPRTTKSVLLLVYGEYVSEIVKLIAEADPGKCIFDVQVTVFDQTGSRAQVDVILNQVLHEERHDLVGFYDSSLVPENNGWLQSMASMASTGRFGVVGAKCISHDGILCGGPVFSDSLSSLSSARAGMVASPQATEDSRGYIASLLLDQTVTRLSQGFMIFRRELIEGYKRESDKAADMESVIDGLCDHATDRGLGNAWSPKIVFRKRSVGPVKEVGNAVGTAVGTAVIGSGFTDTNAPPPFLYPNPNFKSIDWRIRWSKNE
ncbi:MAG: glycosyltransferase [Haliea sp.]